MYISRDITRLLISWEFIKVFILLKVLWLTPSSETIRLIIILSNSISWWFPILIPNLKNYSYNWKLIQAINSLRICIELSQKLLSILKHYIKSSQDSLQLSNFKVFHWYHFIHPAKGYNAAVISSLLKLIYSSKLILSSWYFQSTRACKLTV